MNNVELRQSRELASLAKALIQAKMFFLAAVLVSVALAVLYLRTAEYKYAAAYTVVPAQGSSAPAGNALAGLASVAGVNLSGGNNVPPLDLYLEQLHSRAVADQLATHDDLMRQIFASEWNVAAKRWQAPNSTVRRISRAVKSALGLPVTEWRAPDGARLQAYIADSIRPKQGDRIPIATISMEHSDPAFAVEFLRTLHLATDGILRRSALQKTGQYIGYLRTTIPQVQIVEARTALAGLLAEQEKARMVASSSTPYAADILDPPHATAAPTTPRTAIILLGAALLGLAISLAVVLIRYQLQVAR